LAGALFGFTDFTGVVVFFFAIIKMLMFSIITISHKKC
jgi:hypothetical protein